jgi:hypothetical protein
MHFLLFVPSPKHTPLQILDTHGHALTPSAFMVTGRGGVCIYEGAEELHTGPRTISSDQLKVGGCKHVISSASVHAHVNMHVYVCAHVGSGHTHSKVVHVQESLLVSVLICEMCVRAYVIVGTMMGLLHGYMTLSRFSYGTCDTAWKNIMPPDYTHTHIVYAYMCVCMSVYIDAFH